jgi:hypothetical protein
MRRHLAGVDGAAAYADAAEALACLADRLRASQGRFFFGDRPSSLDALLFGHAAFYLHSPIAAPVLRAKVRERERERRTRGAEWGARAARSWRVSLCARPPPAVPLLLQRQRIGTPPALPPAPSPSPPPLPSPGARPARAGALCGVHPAARVQLGGAAAAGRGRRGRLVGGRAGGEPAEARADGRGGGGGWGRGLGRPRRGGG